MERKRVLYSCPFVPAEWIAAHGLRPSRVMPRPALSDGASAAMGTGVCPYARAFLHETRREPPADAVILTTVCDQMRRVAEWVARDMDRPVFLLHVPKTWQTTAADALYRSELERLGRFLVRLGGVSPVAAALAEVMREYDGLRATLRRAAGRLSPRAYAEAIADFHREGIVRDDGAPWTGSGVPVAVLGGPMTSAHLDLFDRIEEAGGWVALDGTETGERTLPGPFDLRRLCADPLGQLVEAYFRAIPDAFRRPNTGLYHWLKYEISARGMRGVIFRRYLWCDTWAAEAQRLKEWASVPVLVLEAEDDTFAPARTRSAITAFLESLS
jgi:benzoyl-CoA reductase/2-hydroxyglutaryl-CoA dehydratase subunit BcrC/BadD/HgdB